jgi:hypothetical protein
VSIVWFFFMVSFEVRSAWSTYFCYSGSSRIVVWFSSRYFFSIGVVRYSWIWISVVLHFFLSGDPVLTFLLKDADRLGGLGSSETSVL